MAAFYNDLYKYLKDDTGNVEPPDFSDVIDVLDYSELHRMTYIRATDSASYENGAAIENVHQMAALIREYDISSKRKSDYYTDASAEANRESDYYANMKTFWVSMLGGIYVEGDAP
jgi:hypothetical protein